MPGIYDERARTLNAIFEIARNRFATDPELQSVLLLCSQYWDDEADDAVQHDLFEATSRVPGSDARSVDWELRRQVLKWNANRESMFAFAPICTEEGWEETTNALTGPVSVYAHHDAPVIVVQRDGDQLRGSWLGRPHRSWLDVPTAHQDRQWGIEPARPDFVPDPDPPELLGREREIYEHAGFDRGPRDVLRDLWLDRGDPRGDYCSASDPNRVDHVRAAELVANHGRSWVGALQSVIPLGGAMFGYGPFIESAIVYATAEALEAVADAAEWRTIERLELARGSARVLLPAMKQIRAIGPLGLDDLRPLREPGWQIRDLDLEVDRDPDKLATLELPLEILRLRPARSVDLESWIQRLGSLAGAWPTLRRLEVWLPGGADDPAAEIVKASTQLAPRLPMVTTVVGMLDAYQRTGWTVVTDRGGRRLELRHPDPRLGLGSQLAAATNLPLSPPLVELDDWLTFALGVPSIQPLHVSRGVDL